MDFSPLSDRTTVYIFNLGGGLLSTLQVQDLLKANKRELWKDKQDCVGEGLFFVLFFWVGGLDG